jgi:hypothetical protein
MCDNSSPVCCFVPYVLSVSVCVVYFRGVVVGVLHCSLFLPSHLLVQVAALAQSW